MTERPHTDKNYERELTRLREQILLIGAEVEGMIGSSLRALVTRDSALAQQVIDRDRQVDLLELQIDGIAIHTLALHQPVASDLRFIAVVLKIVRDFERIGDLTVNTSERVIELNLEPPLKPYVGISRMAEIAQGMVHDVLDALIHANVALAHEIIERDNTVDGFYDQIFRELLTYMMEQPANIHRITRLQAIAKYMERIADHATNVAEMVIFMARGTDIRHASPDGEPPAQS